MSQSGLARGDGSSPRLTQGPRPVWAPVPALPLTCRVALALRGPRAGLFLWRAPPPAAEGPWRAGPHVLWSELQVVPAVGPGSGPRGSLHARALTDVWVTSPPSPPQPTSCTRGPWTAGARSSRTRAAEPSSRAPGPTCCGAWAVPSCWSSTTSSRRSSRQRAAQGPLADRGPSPCSRPRADTSRVDGWGLCSGRVVVAGTPVRASVGVPGPAGGTGRPPHRRSARACGTRPCLRFYLKKITSLLVPKHRPGLHSGCSRSCSPGHPAANKHGPHGRTVLSLSGRRLVCRGRGSRRQVLELPGGAAFHSGWRMESEALSAGGW